MIRLPELNIIERKDGNIIKQVLDTVTEAEVIVESPLILQTKDGEKILVSRKGNKIDKGYKYVIQTSRKPTKERLEAEEFRLRWIKHPKKRVKLNKDRVVASWMNKFNIIEEDLSRNINGLRNPQVGALYSVLSHWKSSDDRATVVLPTGTGKTETMLSLMVHEKCETLLVSVPSDSLRDQVANKFNYLGLLKEFGLLKDTAEYPIVGVLKKKFSKEEDLVSMLQTCNVVITTMSILSGYNEQMKKLFNKHCTHYFVDEAHHVMAPSWENFVDSFDENKVVQFTATPFRNDGKRLKGKIIFNYPLLKAQEEGYFKKINFNPIFEYDPRSVDYELCKCGVELLENDIKDGFNHVLMARCNTTSRAKEVFEYYSAYKHLQPVIIYNNLPKREKDEAIRKLINLETKIVVCVDMLGEGFDLPNLKIAVFHDVRQSLPITLQVAGRFTRTKYDEVLGEASFVVNLADVTVKDELEDLYSFDSDWNELLANKSGLKIKEEVDFKDFMNGFDRVNNGIPIQNLKPALSAVVYNNKQNKWNYRGFENFIDIKKDDIVEYRVNPENKVIVVIRGRKTDIKWGNVKEIQDLTWDLLVIYQSDTLGLLFINSTDKSTLYSKLAKHITDDTGSIISRTNVFKAFYNIKRIRLQNVGLKEFLGRNIRFRMSVGADVEEALSIEEKKRGQKAFVVGTGYENGNKINLGCSYKGRIWTHLVGDVKKLIEWCENIGSKLNKADIDGNIILKETLIPEYVSEFPETEVHYIDWDEVAYELNEKNAVINYGFAGSFLDEVEIEFVEKIDESNIMFDLAINDDLKIRYKYILYEENEIDNYRIELVDKKYITATITYKKTKRNLLEYLNDYVPVIWFVDGSSLTGNEYVKLSSVITPYDKDRIIGWNWSDVDIKKEAQGVMPKITDSIQYKVIQDLKKKDYDIIYDDDGKGEIADIVTLKETDEFILIELYHLKYSRGGSVNRQISNLYEVCGQVQKSVHWKHKDSKLFFDHLIRRKTKRKNESVCSRFEVGDEEVLKKLSLIAKKKLPVKIAEFLVQPGISQRTISDDQLTLLAVTDNFMKEFGGMELIVIGSE